MSKNLFNFRHCMFNLKFLLFVQKPRKKKSKPLQHMKSSQIKLCWRKPSQYSRRNMILIIVMFKHNYHHRFLCTTWNPTQRSGSTLFLLNGRPLVEKSRLTSVSEGFKSAVLPKSECENRDL